MIKKLNDIKTNLHQDINLKYVYEKKDIAPSKLNKQTNKDITTETNKDISIKDIHQAKKKKKSKPNKKRKREKKIKNKFLNIFSLISIQKK
jgi:hypothetical protein